MAEFIWQLPNNVDSRYSDTTLRKRGERLRGERPAFTEGVSDPRGNRFNFLDYLLQIARAADLTGFDGIHIQNDPDGDEPWIIAGYVASETSRIKFITEFDANRGSAVYAAKNAMSFQRYTRGRFAWHITSLTDPDTRLRYADRATDADLLPRIGEFIEITKGIVTNSDYNFKGKYFEVLNGGFKSALAKQNVPEIYLSGTDDDALVLSARQADVHIFDIHEPHVLSGKVATLKQLAGDRPLRAGVRLNVIARDDLEEALSDAAHLSSFEQIKNNNVVLVVHPAASNGAKGTLIGSYDGVANYLSQYAALGIDSFVLGGGPHLEEAYRTGENLLPRLKKQFGTSVPKQ